MVNLRHSYRRHRALFNTAIAVLFLLLDVAFAFLIINGSTADMPSESLVFNDDVVQVDRSSAWIFVMTEGAVMRIAPFSTYTYGLSNAPISMQVGQESDGLAIGLSNDSVALIPADMVMPNWYRHMNGTPDVIAVSERGGRSEFNPDTIFVLTENSTGIALVGLSAMQGGMEVMHWACEANVTDVAVSYNSYYIALALDNSTVAVFNRFLSLPLGFIPISGEILEIEYSSSGNKLAVLHTDLGERSVSAYSMPSLAPIADAQAPVGAHNLRLRGEDPSIFIQDGDKIKEWQIAGTASFETIREEEGLVDYLFASVTRDLFTSSDDGINAYRLGRSLAIWNCEVDGSPRLLTNPGGWQVVGYDTNRLLVMDNSRNLSGSGTLWTLFGVLLIAEAATLFGLAYWKRLKALNQRSVVALAAGAFVGIVVAGFFVDNGYVDWVGDIMVYLMVSAATAAVIGLVAWESQAGLGGIVLGTVLGIPIAIAFSLLADFFLWASGYQFPEAEEIFITVGLSLLMGLKMGLAGSLTGAVLSRFYAPK